MLWFYYRGSARKVNIQNAKYNYDIEKTVGQGFLFMRSCVHATFMPILRPPKPRGGLSKAPGSRQAGLATLGGAFGEIPMVLDFITLYGLTWKPAQGWPGPGPWKPAPGIPGAWVRGGSPGPWPPGLPSPMAIPPRGASPSLSPPPGAGAPGPSALLGGQEGYAAPPGPKRERPDAGFSRAPGSRANRPPAQPHVLAARPQADGSEV